MGGERSGRDILARAIARIDQARGLERSQSFSVELPSFTLSIRLKCSAEIRSFVPRQTEPSQILDNRFAKFRTAPRRIEIFNPQDHFAASMACPFLGAKKRRGMSEVQIPGRRRRDSAAIWHFRFRILDFQI